MTNKNCCFNTKAKMLKQPFNKTSCFNKIYGYLSCNRIDKKKLLILQNTFYCVQRAENAEKTVSSWI